MSEEKKNKCQICGGYLFEDDDVVICPVCGAPHHKDCWDSVGHCGVADDHGTDRQYDKLKKAEEERASQNPEGTEEGRKCNFCGRVSKTQGAEFCPYCGQPYNGNGVNHPGRPPFIMQDGVIKIDPYGGLPKDSKIEGETVKDIATFTGNNSARYIHKFKDLNKGNKKSWNWLAFLFPSAWCFSRKMYVNGLLYLVLSVASGLCTDTFMMALQSFGYDPNMSNAAIAEFITRNISNVPIITIVLSFVGLALFFVPRFICGLFGDWSYRGFALDKIKKIRTNNEVDDKDEALAHAGSVSLLLGIVAIFVENYLPPLLLSFLS